MALKAVHVTDVPNLDLLPESASLISPLASIGKDLKKATQNVKKFTVVGHRGSGMNMLQSTDQRMKAIKENTIASFNAAARFPVDFIEFDVQVTKDKHPVIFHDSFILTESNGKVIEKRVTEMTLSEFLSYGMQRGSCEEGKPLLRKTKDANMYKWEVEKDDFLCTLQEAFEQVNPSLGFNIELKFDDHIAYAQNHLKTVLKSILQIVFDYAKERPIIFSSFQPDAALLVRQLQKAYPVFFLTNGGNEVYDDERKNSLDEAIKLCRKGGLQGVVSEVRGVLRNPDCVRKMKEAELAVFTYGQLNNVAEVVYVQYLMGTDGVIVDLVKEVTEAMKSLLDDNAIEGVMSKVTFSDKEIEFLLKLIPQLIR